MTLKSRTGLTYTGHKGYRVHLNRNFLINRAGHSVAENFCSNTTADVRDHFHWLSVASREADGVNEVCSMADKFL